MSTRDTLLAFRSRTLYLPLLASDNSTQSKLIFYTLQQVCFTGKVWSDLLKKSWVQGWPRSNWSVFPSLIVLIYLLYLDTVPVVQVRCHGLLNEIFSLHPVLHTHTKKTKPCLREFTPKYFQWISHPISFKIVATLRLLMLLLGCVGDDIPNRKG